MLVGIGVGQIVGIAPPFPVLDFGLHLPHLVVPTWAQILHGTEFAVLPHIPLTLSGHTHGGQLMLTRQFGAGSIAFKYWSGLYRKADSSLVVSNGTGNWFPLRINAPSEIGQIVLHAN